MSIFNKADKHLLTFIENSSFSPSLVLIIFILLTFIFCFILAYKTGISELPSNYYKQAYKYNKEVKKLSIQNKEKKKNIEELNKKTQTTLVKLYKSRIRFERQAYALLSKELTKENYNEDIDVLADKASEILSEVNSVVDETEDNIVKDIYGFEG